jgi:hypothetical protein
MESGELMTSLSQYNPSTQRGMTRLGSDYTAQTDQSDPTDYTENQDARDMAHTLPHSHQVINDALAQDMQHRPVYDKMKAHEFGLANTATG